MSFESPQHFRAELIVNDVQHVLRAGVNKIGLAADRTVHVNKTGSTVNTIAQLCIASTDTNNDILPEGITLTLISPDIDIGVLLQSGVHHHLRLNEPVCISAVNTLFIQKVRCKFYWHAADTVVPANSLTEETPSYVSDNRPAPSNSMSSEIGDIAIVSDCDTVESTGTDVEARAARERYESKAFNPSVAGAETASQTFDKLRATSGIANGSNTQRSSQPTRYASTKQNADNSNNNNKSSKDSMSKNSLQHSELTTDGMYWQHNVLDCISCHCMC